MYLWVFCLYECRSVNFVFSRKQVIVSLTFSIAFLFLLYFIYFLSGLYFIISILFLGYVCSFSSSFGCKIKLIIWNFLVSWGSPVSLQTSLLELPHFFICNMFLLPHFSWLFVCFCILCKTAISSYLEVVAFCEKLTLLFNLALVLCCHLSCLSNCFKPMRPKNAVPIGDLSLALKEDHLSGLCISTGSGGVVQVVGSGAVYPSWLSGLHEWHGNILLIISGCSMWVVWEVCVKLIFIYFLNYLNYFIVFREKNSCNMIVFIEMPPWACFK